MVPTVAAEKIVQMAMKDRNILDKIQTIEVSGEKYDVIIWNNLSGIYPIRVFYKDMAFSNAYWGSLDQPYNQDRLK